MPLQIELVPVLRHAPRPTQRLQSAAENSANWRFPLFAVFAPVIMYARLLRAMPFAADDFQWVYQRIPGYLDALAAGQIPPRTFPHAFEGAGYAFAHYYPPLGHWVAAAIAAITGSPVHGVHLSFLAAVVLASLFMFYLGRRLGGSDRIGLAAALVYTALPYHVADVYVRGALAETWAFAWFPAIALAGIRGVEKGRASLPLAFAVCALVLSHTIIALYFAIACAVALVWVWRDHGTLPAIQLLAAAAAGGALTLWYLLPMHGFLDVVWAGDPRHMLTTERAVRLGAPAPGSFYSLLGLAPWLLLGLALARSWPRGARHPWVRRLLLVTAAYTVYAHLPGPFQVLLPAQLAYIQFSWRTFSITAFLCSAALALIPQPRRSAGTEVLITTLAVASALPLAWGAGARQKETADFQARGDVAYTVSGEYLPKPLSLGDAAWNAARLREQLGGISMTFADGGYTVVAPGASETRQTVLPLHYYPFYAATTATGEHVPIRNDGGYVSLPVDDTPVRVRVVNPHSFWLGLAFGIAGAGLIVLVNLAGTLRTALARRRTA